MTAGSNIFYGRRRLVASPARLNNNRRVQQYATIYVRTGEVFRQLRERIRSGVTIIVGIDPMPRKWPGLWFLKDVYVRACILVFMVDVIIMDSEPNCNNLKNWYCLDVEYRSGRFYKENIELWIEIFSDRKAPIYDQLFPCKLLVTYRIKVPLFLFLSFCMIYYWRLIWFPHHSS